MLSQNKHHLHTLQGKEAQVILLKEATYLQLYFILHHTILLTSSYFSINNKLRIVTQVVKQNLHKHNKKIELMDKQKQKTEKKSWSFNEKVVLSYLRLPSLLLCLHSSHQDENAVPAGESGIKMLMYFLAIPIPRFLQVNRKQIRKTEILKTPLGKRPKRRQPLLSDSCHPTPSII